jgi:hypothetical protein
MSMMYMNVEIVILLILNINKKKRVSDDYDSKFK